MYRYRKNEGKKGRIVCTVCVYFRCLDEVLDVSYVFTGLFLLDEINNSKIMKGKYYLEELS